MKWDIFPYLDYLFAFKLAFLNNLGYAISALCYLIIFMKIKHSSSTGAFRLYLLGYFGAAALTSLCMTIYHPLYNDWLLTVSHSLVFVALLCLTAFILNEFWAKKNR